MITPAPWKWESIPGARGKKRRVLMGGLPDGPQHKILTQASDCVSTDAVHERLIAAAPEMFAVCKELKQLVDRISTGSPHVLPSGTLVFMLRDVLVKLEGIES